MRILLLTLSLTLFTSLVNAQQITVWDLVNESRQVVERHSKVDDPVKVEDIGLSLMPPYFAQKYLRGEEYASWALTWNVLKDEQARRASGERVLFGRTTRITNTIDGTVREVTPRFWSFPFGVPGEIRYNPFVTPGS